MKFTFSRRHEKERRMIAFAPPPSPGEGQAPEPQTPPEGERPKLDAVLGKLGESIDNAEARQVVEELKVQATADQNKAQEKLVATLGKASQLEFDFLIKATTEGGMGMTPEAALTEIKTDFGARFPSFVDFKLEGGKLVMVSVSAETKERPEPTTQEERISQGIEDAMNVLNDKNASIGKKLAAVFKIFALGKEFLKRAMDGTLGDPFESNKSKQSREARELAQKRKEMRDKIRNDLKNNGGNFDQLRDRAQTDLDKKKNELKTEEAQLKAEETSLADLRKQLTDTPGDEPNKAKREQLTKSIAEQEKKVSDQTEKVKAKQKEVNEAQVYLDEITTIETERNEAPQKMTDVIQKLGIALTSLTNEEAKNAGAILKAAKVIPGDGVD